MSTNMPIDTTLPSTKRLRPALVKSSIMFQLSIHYVIFVAILLLARLLYLDAGIYPYGVLFYFNVVYGTLQCSRLAYVKNANSLAPVYLSLLPLAIVLVLSRNLHVVVGLLWMVSFLIAFLQSGLHHLKSHLALYVLLFLVTYYASVGFMHWFYGFTCTTFACLDSSLKPIVWAEEAFWTLTFLVLSICFFTLLRFIKLNASTLLDREVYLHTLLQTNLELKRELKRLKLTREADLNAPLTRIIQIFKDIRSGIQTDMETKLSLDFIMKILTSENFFAPTLETKSKDQDVVDFLSNLTQKTPTSALERKLTPSLQGSKEPLRLRHQNSSPHFIGNSENASFQTVNLSKPSHLDPSVPPVILQPNLQWVTTNSLTDSTPMKVSSSFVTSKETVDPLGGGNGGNLRYWKVHRELQELPPDTLSKIETNLTLLGTPDFNVIELNELSHGHPLYFTAMKIFEFHQLFQNYELDVTVFQNFILKIESGYHSTNPYHNALHAADVVGSLHFYLICKKILPHLPLDDIFASLIAAIIHDYQHPGFNNVFLVATSDRLALMYNDQAVLEHFHCAAAFHLMESDPMLNIFEKFPLDRLKIIREFIISLVLATDMTSHFEFVSRFKNKLNVDGGIDWEKRADRKLTLSIAIKCADINNPSKPLLLCKQWTEYVMEEFFRQGDEEKRRGMEASQLMDRDNTDIPKCQVGFIDFVVAPLFAAWETFLGEEIEELIDNISSNKVFWKNFSERSSLHPSVDVRPTSRRRSEGKAAVSVSTINSSASSSGRKSPKLDIKETSTHRVNS
ncbi:High affinity cAMP-specific 3',5'-cyclic phosphodiesterase 7A [Coelomomyces lativittatus]|nr:High affinity cAMP-specific 3',5'-cyclic phosphodiesterase 7A [Coelomomyces lativittatus]KAJ1518395.1 High affinity cAMP-specific 3',5'-cyclic phosphodiesterase 7A [Coelomomyces lativittatus]KAJ1518740.1 High affinity cAMP-specific 3',5'-cyclic phosphodiesterase 7A [Coelomomyces lativittatus]